MCTAITFKNKDHYFGRNLDLGCSLNEQIVITPRSFPLPFRKTSTLSHHYAMIGVAYVPENYPLYYDATNEVGLSMAGLNFPGLADYKDFQPDKDNIAPFEFIPWVLGQCASVQETLSLLEHMNLFLEDYSSSLKASPLHWMIADSESSLVIESVEEGLKIYDNPIGVLTNIPSFDKQRRNLESDATKLPGDWSSSSRFTRAAYVKSQTPLGQTEQEDINQFFQILNSVTQPRGCTQMPTQYSSCCNATRGIYYYKTYENSQISAVNLHHENLEESILKTYPLLKNQQIHLQN